MNKGGLLSRLPAQSAPALLYGCTTHTCLICHELPGNSKSRGGAGEDLCQAGRRMPVLLLNFTARRARMVLQNQNVRPGLCTNGFDRIEDLETKKRIRFGVDTLFYFPGWWEESSFLKTARKGG
jgi:hypothetical protein